MGYTITNLLAESLNASVEYNFVDTWGYGDMRYPTKLKGMMGHLVRHEIDVGGRYLKFHLLLNLCKRYHFRHCFVHNTRTNSTRRVPIGYFTQSRSLCFQSPTAFPHIQRLLFTIRGHCLDLWNFSRHFLHCTSLCYVSIFEGNRSKIDVI